MRQLPHSGKTSWSSSAVVLKRQSAETSSVRGPILASSVWARWKQVDNGVPSKEDVSGASAVTIGGSDSYWGKGKLETPTTSSTLLELLQHTPLHDNAWEEFFRRYYDWMVHRCRRLNLQHADAEDVTGRVLQKLVKVFRTFRHDPRKRFRGYLATIIVNELRSYFRELGRNPGALGAGYQDHEAWLASAAVQGLSQELDSRVLRDLDLAVTLIENVRTRVQEKTWQAYAMTTLENRPPSDVAAELKMSLSSVYVARNRIRKMLEQAAADIMPPPTKSRETPQSSNPKSTTGVNL
jgi:RNA polymerase sigma factor (sigma-70 family)